MADRSIGELTAATQVYPADLFVLEQNSAAKKLTGQTLENWLVSFADGHGGIQDISKTGSSGTNPVVDTYTITLADTTTATFTVTNGLKGDTGAAVYTHIKYAGQQPTSNSDMEDIPDNYIGIYTGTSSTAPVNYTSYTWYQWKGNTGAPAEVQSTAIEYQASDSGTTPPSGTWYNSVQAVSQGDFLWTRVTVTFTGNVSAQFYSVARQGVDGEGAAGTNTPLVDYSGGVIGSSNAFAREDHRHPFNVPSTGAPIVSGGSGSNGAASTYARSDHWHPASTTTFTVTLTNNDWSSKAQDVTDARFITTGYVYYVSPNSLSYEDYVSCQIYADDVSTAGKMTFHCKETPSDPLTVNVVREVTA